MAQVRRIWLGSKGLESLAKQYELLGKDLEKVTQGALDYAAEKTMEVYKASLPPGLRGGVDSEWQSSGKYYRMRIKNTDERAIYVEYGTGQNGERHPYEGDMTIEGSFPYSGYNTGEHSSVDEFVVFRDGRRIFVPRGKWLTQIDGKPKITAGQPAKSQMYHAKRYYDTNKLKLAKYYFEQNGFEVKEK